MKTRRTPNYASRSTAASLAKQEQLQRWLRVADEGLSISELAALTGISRQLVLYHVKKLAAQRGLIMMLEPCENNGGLQFRVWDHAQFARNYFQAVAAYRMAA